MLKNTIIVLITILLETLFLWVVSILINWKFIDVMFIGGLVIFGVIWLFQFNSTQTQNILNASEKGWKGQKTGEIRPFEFKFTPVKLGLLIFAVISFFITMTTYSSYFASSFDEISRIKEIIR